MLGATWESINIYTDYMIKTDKLWELDFILLEEWQIWYLEKEH